MIAKIDWLVACRGLLFGMSWVLFFDESCGVCSSSVRWVARRDKQRLLSFAPLQGELGSRLGLSHHADPKGGTVVLRNQETEQLYFKSDAVIRLMGLLGGIWGGASVIRLIPRPIRDALYVAFARRRHWISKQVCELPDDDLTSRLLD